MPTPKTEAHPVASENPFKPIDEYAEEFRRAAHQAVDWAAEYLRDPRKYPVVSQIKPGDLIDALPPAAPARGEAYGAILRDFERVVLPAVTHWNHPRFLAYFACTGSAPAVIAEMLAAALNTNGLHWITSPAISELEQVSLGWLRQWIGLPEDWFGIIYDTASVSSLHALAAARSMAVPDVRENGVHEPLTVYTSEQSHSSIDKAAITLGIGHKNVRRIATDAEFRMRPDALENAIRDDLAAGRKPICVVATVGTTSSTSVDPVEAIAAISDRYNLWLHIDAAYAGSAAVLPEYKWILKGAERAHSLVMNPHKWLFTPVDLSAFFTRRPDMLREAFALTPAILRPTDSPRAVNYMDYGVPLGRRFRSLKLWFLMRYFGRDGIERLLRAHIAWAQKLAAIIDADSEFERAAPVPFSVICFRYKGSDDDNRAILEKVNASGQAYISNTSLNGRIVLRIAIGNFGTTWADIEQTWQLVRASAPQA